MLQWNDLDDGGVLAIDAPVRWGVMALELRVWTLEDGVFAVWELPDGRVLREAPAGEA